jgi:hypothetical protein
VWRGVGSIVRKCGEGFVVATRTTATACTRTPSGGGPGRAPKGEDSVERGTRAGYTGERARSPSIIPSVTSNLGTRFFHSQSVWRLLESSLSGAKSPKKVRKIGKDRETSAKISLVRA